MAAQRLFLLDAYALIFRAHFAFAKNPRMTMQLKNLGRKDRDELRAIRRQADTLRK